MKIIRPSTKVLLVLACLTLAGSTFAAVSFDRDLPRLPTVLNPPVEDEITEQIAEALQEITTESVEAMAVVPECGWPRLIAPVAVFLQLDEVQINMLVQLLEQRRIAVAPIAWELRQLEAELADLLQATAPDPVLVGQKVLEIRELRHAVVAIQAEFLAEFAGLLNLEQRHRLALVRAAFAIRHVLPAFALLHLI